MERTRAGRRIALEWLAIATLVASIKLAWFVADPTMRVFLGDSASYLWSALKGAPPLDRSMTYPLLLGWLALPAPTLAPMLAWQTLFGALTALLLFGTLRTWLGVSFALACGAAAVFATEPAQIAFERFLMAESAGTYCFAAALASGVGYVRTRGIRFLVYGAIAGLGAASLRLSLLPVVLGMALLPPLVVLLEAAWRRDRRAMLGAALGLVVAAFATKYAHGYYQRWYDLWSTAVDEPSYSGREGAMRLALVAPLVKREHLARQGLDPSLLDQVGQSLRDPEKRELQLWAEDGLVVVIERSLGDHLAAERIMRKIATRAVREDPLGFLAFAPVIARGYFDDAVAAHRVADDMGIRGPTAEDIRWMREEFGYEAQGIANRASPATVWFVGARWWFTACLFLLVPLVAAAAWVNRRRGGDVGVYLVLVAAGMTAAHLLFSAIVSYRYLHAFPFVALLALAWLADGLRQNRANRAPT